jgi:hypothetical protein
VRSPTFTNGKQRGLGIQGVEDCLDKKDIRTTFNQAANSLCIGNPEIIKADGPVSGIVHIR